MDEERWAEMPGFPAHRISTLGRGAVVLPDGRMRIKQPRIVRGRAYFRMRSGESRRYILVERAVVTAFWEHLDLPFVVIHKDGDPLNNKLDNLVVKQHRNGRYRVEKIDARGAVLDRYDSAAEAARQNFMSYGTIIQRCRGKTKHPFRDGFSFRFADDRGDGR